jgi:hypothetical protein
MAGVAEIRYARAANRAHIAKQAVGDGPPDIVCTNSFVSHIEAYIS